MAGRSLGRQDRVARRRRSWAYSRAGLDRRRRGVVGAAPEHELLLAVLGERRGLVLALQRAVVPLVEPPRAPDRDPRAGRPRASASSAVRDRAAQQRGVHARRAAGRALDQQLAAAARPRLGPSRSAATSTQPVNRFVSFHSLSPWRSSTRVPVFVTAPSCPTALSARPGARPARARTGPAARDRPAATGCGPATRHPSAPRRRPRRCTPPRVRARTRSRRHVDDEQLGEHELDRAHEQRIDERGGGDDPHEGPAATRRRGSGLHHPGEVNPRELRRRRGRPRTPSAPRRPRSRRPCATASSVWVAMTDSRSTP